MKYPIDPRSWKVFNDPIRVFQSFNIARQIAVFTGSILLAKSTLTLHEIGNFETLLYLGQFLTVFWFNGLSQSLLALYPKIDGKDKKVLIANTFTLFTLMVFLITTVFILFKPFLLPLLTSSRELTGLTMFCLYMVLNIPALLIPTILLLKDEYKEMIKFSMFYCFGYILVFTLNLFFHGDLYNLLWLLNIFAFCLFIFSARISIDFKAFKFNKPLIKRLLLLSSPLIGYSIITGFAPLFDSWLVFRIYKDESIFALYRYGAKEFPLTATLAVGLGTALLPTVSKNLELGLTQLKERSKRIYPIIFGISIILILCSQQLFYYLFNPNFTQSVPIFNIFVLIIITRLVYPQTILMGLNKTKVILLIAIAELFINMAASTLLGIYFGLVGIAIGTLIANVFEKSVSIIYLNYKYKIPLSSYCKIDTYLFYSLALIGVWFLTYLFN